MFRTPYLVRIKVLIINQLKMFYSPFSSGSQPSLLFSSSNFLVNLLPTSVYSTYKPLILDGFLEILVSLLILQEWIQKLPLFLMVAANFW
jgi:hypothetical protein